MISNDYLFLKNNKNKSKLLPSLQESNIVYW